MRGTRSVPLSLAMWQTLAITTATTRSSRAKAAEPPTDIPMMRSWGDETGEGRGKRERRGVRVNTCTLYPQPMSPMEAAYHKEVAAETRWQVKVVSDRNR